MWRRKYHAAQHSPNYWKQPGMAPVEPVSINRVPLQWMFWTYSGSLTWLSDTFYPQGWQAVADTDLNMENYARVLLRMEVLKNPIPQLYFFASTSRNNNFFSLDPWKQTELKGRNHITEKIEIIIISPMRTLCLSNDLLFFFLSPSLFKYCPLPRWTFHILVVFVRHC